MTVRRGFLYFGVFLVAAGGVTLLTAAGVLDPDAVLAALAWWPVAIIAIGVGLMLRRTRAAVPGGIVAAAVPGLLLGATFAAVPELPSPCMDLDQPGRAVVTREGSFAGTPSVDLSLACGDLTVTTVPGTAWRVDAGDGAKRRTDITADADHLVVDSDGRSTRFAWDAGAVDWDVALPTGPALDLDVEINAGRGRLDLDGARLTGLAVDVNAGEARVDLTGAVVPRLDMHVNAAAATVVLPATGNMAGDLDVNAGSLDVCVPADLGLRVTATASLGSTTFNGLIRRGDAWETPGYDTAQFRADLSVSASVGSVDVNSEGACK